MTIAEIKLWGRTIGATVWNPDSGLASFEFDPAFGQSGIQLAPFKMPLSTEIYSFPALSKDTFKGLPGLLADGLPDDFGNALIDTWLAANGRAPESFNPVERLCYVGQRGMGAMEYIPDKGPANNSSENLDVDSLVNLASQILSKRTEVTGSLSSEKSQSTLTDILQVGTSAGGARAKAIIAWNQQTNEIRSGQINASEGFTYWILKFDGVAENKDKELADPKGYGQIEYAYYKMALAAGISMNDCLLYEENGRKHFMAKRFDRAKNGSKIHMQSFGAMEHFDYRQPGAYSYEQAMQTIRKLNMPMASIEEQYRRMAFNIFSRNQDDHVKNISFLMNQNGEWSLSPAYDVTYSYNPDGSWTHKHQMTLNNKRENFISEDFYTCAENLSIMKNRAKDILKEVQEAILHWEHFAEEAGVVEDKTIRIKNSHITSIAN